MSTSMTDVPPEPPLIPARLRWPLSVERLGRLINLPSGFRAEMAGGRLRIGHSGSDEALLGLAGKLAAELPESFSLEVYDGHVVIGGTTDLRHDRTVQLLDEMLREPAADRGWLGFQTAGLIDSATGLHAAPDFMLVDAEARVYGRALHSADVHLVAEVTAPDSTDDDHEIKPGCYARAGIPVFLLVDLERRAIVVHWKPGLDGYRERLTSAATIPLALPAPVSMTVDSAALFT